MKKHYGFVKNTGNQIVVVFRQLPDDPNSCLVIEYQRLPDKFKDMVNEALNSNEAQKTIDFYNVIHNRHTSTGQTVLAALHIGGFLKAYATSSISLRIGQQDLPLDQFNKINDDLEKEKLQASLNASALNQSLPVSAPTIEDKVAELADANVTTLAEAAPLAPAAKPITKKLEAESLLVEAALLRDKAKELEEQAYDIKPSLRPKKSGKQGRPTLSKDADEALEPLRKKKKEVANKTHFQNTKQKTKASEVSQQVKERVERDSKGPDHTQ